MNKEQFEIMKGLIRFDEFMHDVYKTLNIVNPDAISEFVQKIVPTVLKSKEKEPFAMFDQVFNDLKEIWTASEKIPYNAQWIHGLLPAVLINSLKNNGYDFTERDVREAFTRGFKLPAAGCGFCGVCGATSGAGIVVSMILKSTPFHDEERAAALGASLIAAGKLKEIGGVRCCRMSSYIAIDETIEILKKYNISLPEKNLGRHCPINSRLNDECNGNKCPYFPKTN
jgi:hypothetical protein